MMKRPPFYQHYPDDFVTGCLRSCMTPEQVGMYIMLLDIQWLDQGPVEADYRRISLITGFELRVVKRLVAELITKGKFAAGDDKRLRNVRMQTEIEKFAKKAKAERADAGGHTPAHTPEHSDPHTGERGDLHTGEPKPELSGKGNENNVADPKQAGYTGATLESRLQTSESRTKITPPPPKGGEPGKAALPRAEKAKSNAEERRRTTDAAFDLWNATAGQHNFGVVEVRTEERRNKLAKRLEDIGGLDQFRAALAMIPADDFLMGRQPPRGGDTPFRLTFERLLSAGSQMGDVLARLLDSAAQAGRPAAQSASTTRKPPRENWWMERPIEDLRETTEAAWADLINTWAHGFWPIKYLGPPPGDPNCVVNPAVIESEKLIERFGAPEKHVH